MLIGTIDNAETKVIYMWNSGSRAWCSCSNIYVSLLPIKGGALICLQFMLISIEKDTNNLELSIKFAKLCIDYTTMRPSGDTGLGLRKGAWTAEEDMLLKNCIHENGEGKWHLIPIKAGLNRCRKSCRLRWLNYLSPKIKKGNFEEDEIDLILRLHKLLGNRWSLIAGRIPGRTGNDVKNYWNTYIRSRSIRQNSEPKEDTRAMATVIKPQPQTLAKPLTCNPPPVVAQDNAFDISLGLISSPMVPDDMIKEYLNELHEDTEIGWSLDDHAMKGRVLDVEQKVGERSFFDLPIDESTWYYSDLLDI